MKLTRFNTVVYLFFALLLVIAQEQLLIHQTDLEAHLDHVVCDDPIHSSSAGSGAILEDGLSVPPSGLTKYSISNYSEPVTAFYHELQQPRAPPVSSLS